jgi:16S rRNA processing protein RimM
VTEETEHWLSAGVVGRPHGLDGSFHVAEPVAALLELGTEVRVAGILRLIVRLAGHAGRPIVRLEGCEDRSAAEALRGQELFVGRGAAPALDEDEWWATDLEGCTVRDGERELGVVARLLALPSCEVLEVSRGGGAPDLLVPLVRDAVRDVDLDRRVIDVDLEFLGEA